MIILDEQLLGLDLEVEIAKWYPGTVQFITDLSPGSVIKDDRIPALLREQNQSTFITINEKDFWRRLAADYRFCIVCFAFSNARAREIPPLLRMLFNMPQFDTKNKRMGKVIRWSVDKVVHYYHRGHSRVFTA